MTAVHIIHSKFFSHDQKKHEKDIDQTFFVLINWVTAKNALTFMFASTKKSTHTKTTLEFKDFFCFFRNVITQEKISNKLVADWTI